MAKAEASRSRAEHASFFSGETFGKRAVRASLWMFLLTLLGAVVSFYAAHRVEVVIERQLRAVLSSTHGLVISGLRGQLEFALAATKEARASDELRAFARGCQRGEPTCSDRAFGEVVKAYSSKGAMRFAWLVDDALTVRAYAPSAGVPSALARDDSALDAALRTLARRAREREVALVAARVEDDVHLLFGARLSLEPKGEPNAEATAEPTRASGGATLVLAWPTRHWRKILQSARLGDSGESYVIDAHGLLLSEPRFVSELRARGLLAEGSPAALVFRVRDPGSADAPRALSERARWPLTHSASEVARGRQGVTLTPYRDYRGVPVVGTYAFLPELELGVITEVDEATAYSSMTTLRASYYFFFALLVLTALALLSGALVNQRMRKRMARAERYGQYRLERELGHGGMGTVYLARHALLRRPAAIKVLRKDRATEEAVARFEREVSITSTLTHPNTVAVFDYGRTESGELFYVMEYLEGLDLQALVARFGPLPDARVIHFLRQLCGSLSEAHEKQLVHRDIKPANLFSCRYGGVFDSLKVLDFGVAKLLDQSALGLTHSRTLLGTPEYMAPELLESSDAASPRSDLYSVGAVGYFLLTGTPVHCARSLMELTTAVLMQDPEPPSARLGRAIDPTLEQIVLACLARQRERRPPSARAIIDLLERSPLARAWTRRDAEAFWHEHEAELDVLRKSRTSVEPFSEKALRRAPRSETGA